LYALVSFVSDELELRLTADRTSTADRTKKHTLPYGRFLSSLAENPPKSVFTTVICWVNRQLIIKLLAMAFASQAVDRLDFCPENMMAERPG